MSPDPVSFSRSLWRVATTAGKEGEAVRCAASGVATAVMKLNPALNPVTASELKAPRLPAPEAAVHVRPNHDPLAGGAKLRMRMRQ